MKQVTKLSFDNLLQDVVNNNLCNKCGGCVSFCSANDINALKTDSDGLPCYADKDKCLEDGICYLICPKTPELEEEVKNKHNWKYPIGSWVDAFSARSTDDDILEVATDGGVVSSLLLYMLDNKIIDGAVVSKRADNCGRLPMIARNKTELIDAAGSFFSEAAHLDAVGKIYSSLFPIIKVIKESASKNMKRLALIGTPCQIKAIRKMQLINIVPSDMIIFTIGLFCMQCFTLEDLISQNFALNYNINIDDIKKVNIKDKLILQMKSGISMHIPLDEIAKITRPACISCSDFANDLADISVGGVGSDEGYTTVIIRNTLGKTIYSDALYHGYIENLHENHNRDRTQTSARLISKISDIAIKKKQRAEQRLKQNNIKA
ncbi:Coenzyme F420 hydrogenase/dehydrogenase, beta subunit C-terminal domain [Candidatus Cloacimonadota bacterium]